MRSIKRRQVGQRRMFVIQTMAERRWEMRAESYQWGRGKRGQPLDTPSYVCLHMCLFIGKADICRFPYNIKPLSYSSKPSKQMCKNLKPIRKYCIHA